MITLWLVIPCFNEDAVLPELAEELKKTISDLINRGKISEQSRIAFVNDGSRDHTWNIVRELNLRDAVFTGINLTRNYGHQKALMAGLMTAKEYADAVISLDADFQDDPGILEQLIDVYEEGTDIVYGVRSKREKDSFWKRVTAGTYYKLLRLLGADIIENHGDYRLMSKRALEGLSKYDEVNLFLRGIIPQIGYTSATVEFDRGRRRAGKTKYSLCKMFSLALEGITSFSIRPIRIALLLGIGAFIVSLIMLVYCLVQHALGGTVSGWTSLSVSIWVLGGLQLLMIGITGEYIGKIYLETKHRPRYLIESLLYRETDSVSSKEKEASDPAEQYHKA